MQQVALMIGAVMLWVFSGCATAPPADTSASSAALQGTGVGVRAALEKSGEWIDYDTLIMVHKTLRQVTGPVEHMDQLLFSLLEKRNRDDRIDQMVVIFTADIIGFSPYPIPNASELFWAILNSGDDRLTNWVLVFVGDALGRYCVDLPDGDELATLLEKRVDEAYRNHDSKREYFGQHFLPPPKSALIQNHISGIVEQRNRESERNAYYFMVSRQYSPEAIEAGLFHLMARGFPGSGDKNGRLRFLSQHWDDVQAAVAIDNTE